MTIKKCFFFAAFALLAIVPLSYAQTIWTGPNITYTHTSSDAENPTLAASTDQLTPNVWITRGTSDGLFNAVTQTSYGSTGSAGSGTPDGSPSDTEWAIGSISDYATLSYSSWDAVLHGADGVGQQAVVHLITENIYLSIEFTSFSEGGTYTYTRSTPAAVVLPAVTITNLANGAVFAAPATVTIGASASATGGTVTNVSFFTNNVLAGSSTVAPYSLVVHGLHVASYSLTAVATAAGISATSAVVNISVVPPPSVTITNPVNGTVFAAPANVRIGASASVVMGSVTNVAFFQGTTSLGSVKVPPFIIVATNLLANPYSLTAVATAAGLSITSSVVNISVVTPLAVSNSAPAISGGNFSFDYTANPGLTYVIENSSNLVNWVPIATNVAASSSVSFTNNPGLAPLDFYQVVLQPNP